MFLNGISMYYCFSCSLPSIIVLACHSLLVHQFALPLPPVCHLLRIKVTGIIFVRIRTSNHSAMWSHMFPVMLPPVVVPLLDIGVPLFFSAFICSYRHLIYFACAATVSTEIARLVDNSASGPPFATACVATSAMLSRYPSSESSI